MPGRRMLISDLPWILEDPKSDHCIRHISPSKIYFNWEEVQRHYNIKTQEDSFVHNLRTNYGWTKTCPCSDKCSCLVSQKGYWKHPDLESGAVQSVRDLQPKPSTRIRKRQRRKELKELAKKRQEEAEQRAEDAEAKLREVSRLVNLAETSGVLGPVKSKSRRTSRNSNPRQQLADAELPPKTSMNLSELNQPLSSDDNMSQTSIQTASSINSSTSPIPQTFMGDVQFSPPSIEVAPKQQNGFLLPTSYPPFFQQAPLQMQDEGTPFHFTNKCEPQINRPVKSDSNELPKLTPKLQIITSTDEDVKQDDDSPDEMNHDVLDSDWSESSPHTMSQGYSSINDKSPSPMSLPTPKNCSHIQFQPQPQPPFMMKQQTPISLQNIQNTPIIPNTGKFAPSTLFNANTSSSLTSNAPPLGLQTDARSVVAARMLQMILATRGVNGLNGLMTNVQSTHHTPVNDLRTRLVFNTLPAQPPVFQQQPQQSPFSMPGDNFGMRNDLLQLGAFPKMNTISSMPTTEIPALKPISTPPEPSFIDM